MNLNDKIKQILIDKNISPSHFADEIGIQRSSVSHILAGRNKPSLEIVQKVVRRFPELGLNWILDDEELPPPSPILKEESPDNQQKKAEKAPLRTPSELIENFHSVDSPVQSNLSAKTQEAFTAIRKIERVIIFYTDGSFQEYKS